jgi:hypothetical protein
MKFLKEHQKNNEICPFCGSKDVDYLFSLGFSLGFLDSNTDETEHIFMGECFSCGKSWSDIYKYIKTVTVEDKPIVVR